MKKRTKIHSWLLRFDRSFSERVWRQIFILSGFVLLALAVGTVICYSLTFGEEWENMNFFERSLYILIDGNALNRIYTDNYTEEGSRLWVVTFSVLGSMLGVILFGGMLISVLSNMLERRIENFRNGRNSYVVAGHYVILGYDEIVPSIIKQICDDNSDAYILLQSSHASEEIKEKIHSSIAQGCEKRVIIKNGNRTSAADLGKLRLNEAQEIYIAGDRNKPEHDAKNFDCLEKVYTILKENEKKGIPESITTVFEEQDTYSAMQVTDLFDHIRALGIEFIAYNFYVGWAKQILVDRKYSDNGKTYEYPALDGRGITDSDDRRIHIVIAGTSNFGVTFGAEAAKILHFPNFGKKGKRTRITFIDLNADREKDLFITRFKHFFEVQHYFYNDEKRRATKFPEGDSGFLDTEFSFIKGDIYSPEIQQKIKEWAEDENELLTLVFAMRDSRNNMGIALNLADEVYDREIPIFVRQDSSSIFLTKLREKSKQNRRKIVTDGVSIKEIEKRGRYANLYPIGMTDINFDTDRRAQRMAECINYLYYANESDLEKATWKEIHEIWKQQSVANQWSNLYSAYTIEYRLRTLNALRESGKTKDIEEETEMLSRVEHDRWNVEKLMLGFRKPNKDEDSYSATECGKNERERMNKANKGLFIHSYIRPYDKLDDNQDEIKNNDRRIVRNIPWIIRMANNFDGI